MIFSGSSGSSERIDSEETAAASRGADDGADDDVDDTDTGGDTIADMTADELGATLKEQGFVTEDSIGEHVEATANQREKQDRAKRIVANSAEYDSDDVEWIADLPEKELDRKENAVNASGGAPATAGNRRA